MEYNYLLNDVIKQQKLMVEMIADVSTIRGMYRLWKDRKANKELINFRNAVPNDLPMQILIADSLNDGDPDFSQVMEAAQMLHEASLLRDSSSPNKTETNGN